MTDPVDWREWCDRNPLYQPIEIERKPGLTIGHFLAAIMIAGAWGWCGLFKIVMFLWGLK
jgi:hypothetical protein